MTVQAKYLLRAPAPDMERWKATAARRGFSFADHIRSCLERFEGNEKGWPPVEAAEAEAESAGGAAASTGGAPLPGVGPQDAAVPAVPPVACSEEPAGPVQTPSGPPASPEPVISRTELIDEARRLAARMRV